MNKSLVKDALILAVITLVAGVLLGLVYEITKDPIAKAQEAATQAAYETVFSEAASFVETEGFDSETASTYVHEQGYEDDDIIACLDAKDADGNTLGYVITVTSHAGYGGDITFSMGITNDGTLNGYSITDISETAGLGMKAKEEGFYSQFVNKVAAIFEVTKSSPASDTEIQAISGATITSKAMTYGVDAGIVYYQSLVGGASNE
ncbi:MAG: RnfABCDGE type electron transport complex subunit G [Lachnospiraceae bacterium]|nr:RnfABCDGE type electron transport complex subunit G [Lachnospiraceae bacterium]